MIKEELDFLIQQGEGYNLEDVYFGISFERPDLQKMSVEQRINEYNKEVGFIRRIGPDRGGYWEVIN